MTLRTKMVGRWGGGIFFYFLQPNLALAKKTYLVIQEYLMVMINKVHFSITRCYQTGSGLEHTRDFVLVYP